MKIKTDIRAGACYTTAEGCYDQRDFWKEQSRNMELYAKGQQSAAGLYISAYPPKGYSGSWAGQQVSNAPMTIECINTATGQPVNPPTKPTTPPPTTGGGWVGGVYYADMSGWCSTGTIPTPPPTTGGGWVGGVFYPDRSGVCSAA
jgi:hypothetical protein